MAEPPPYQFGGSNTAQTAPNTPQQLYDAQGNYVQPQTITSSQQMWLDDNGEYRCKRANGTTGTVIGAVAGGVLGNVIAGRGSRTLGTIVGALGGAVVGRMIARGQAKCQ
jgi:outer membrane lipoprotein SlyB